MAFLLNKGHMSVYFALALTNLPEAEDGRIIEQQEAAVEGKSPQ